MVRVESPTVSSFKQQHLARMKEANKKHEEVARKRGSAHSSAGSKGKRSVMQSHVNLEASLAACALPATLTELRRCAY